ncbi:MAG: signal peptidase I [Lachnospiraceae bacterium]|nr:signal peptidase I [Lachnospiraceae bacterium]
MGETAKKRKKRKKNGVLRDVISFSIYLLSVLILTYLVITFVVQRTVVSGDSMSPTLSDGDNILVGKLDYRFRTPKRFDVVVFPYSYEKNTYYIKRIIGMPGETVTINERGEIFINDQKLDETYGAEVIRNPGMALDNVYLKSDEYFVLGDNRNHSSDSRDPSIGPVKADDIVGKAIFRTYPFSGWGSVK